MSPRHHLPVLGTTRRVPAETLGTYPSVQAETLGTTRRVPAETGSAAGLTL
jgi:hypothetical protein